MFSVYDVEVYPNDWMIVFLDLDSNEMERIHNNKGALLKRLSCNHILIGYNNYYYDDLIVAAILKDEDPYEVSQVIMDHQRVDYKLNILTLDVMQELKQGLSLKEAQANLGLNIHETPVDFEKEHLTPEEIERIFQYCENDVRTTAELFQKREAYFTSKFEIVQTFKLSRTDIKKTRASLSAAVLKAKKMKQHPKDRLLFKYDKRLNLNELPVEVIEFYKNIEMAYNHGKSVNVLEKEKLEYELCGVPHTYGFGGLHGARENYVFEGNILQIDVSSFYPTLKINNNFISRAALSPELYKKLYDERLRLKAAEDDKQEVYKVVLTSAFGACKFEYNHLYDPAQFNNIVVNGQLIITHLLLLLDPFCELIQSNTDGIIINYEDGMREGIDEVLRRFSKQYEIAFDVDEIVKIAQRDVNNYCYMKKDGTIKAKGRFTNFEGGSFESNSLAIVDKALTSYYMKNTPAQKTVIDSWKQGQLDLFQVVAKSGKFDGMVNEIDGQMMELQKVNRIFATKDKRYGGVYKVRDGKHHKVSNTSEQSVVWNGDLKDFKKQYIDLNWYVKMIQAQIF